MGQHAEDSAGALAEFGWHAPRRSPFRTCRYCGKGGLVFALTGTGWRLHEPFFIKVLHNCPQYKRPEPHA